ncbi:MULTISPECIES: hypothetical protein [Hyphomicrobiales]|nr:hypothetical protein [Agrobacterium pusense]MDG5969346.1 hypothetical protein [Sphingomonas paucimobilis]
MSAERGKTQTPTMDGMPLKVKNNEAEMDWNKDHIRETMLSLETAALQSARKKYLDYVSTARLDRSEPIENDEQAQAEVASDFAEALDDTLDDYVDKLDKLRTIDFGPKSEVSEGAVVKLSGKHFVISVSTGRFICHGQELMGISTMAPIYEAIEGARAGETVQFNGRDLTVEAVA